MAINTAGTETRVAEGLGEPAVGLRRNLKLWQVIGLSVGLMAPSMAISINPQGAIASVGRAIPLSFVISMVGALFVAYGFARLSQHFNHSGSLLGLLGATLGPRTGTVGAWCLAGCYTLFTTLVAVTAGIFGTTLLNDMGVISNTPNWLTYTIAVVVALLTAVLAMVPTAKATDVILSSEGLTMALIIIAAVVVFVKLLGHSGPGHLHFTLSVFTPAKGTTTSNVFLGVVFGFLSFAGFEGAAALGGESAEPRRDIPRAIIGTVLVIGVFYVAISAIEIMGFGTSKAGLTNFSNSPALLGTLGRTYVAGWFGDIIIAGTIISAVGCCLASIVGASRILFSGIRDGVSPHHPLARLSRHGTPVPAVLAVLTIELVLLFVLGLAAKGHAPLTVFDWTATTGTYLILAAYGLASVGAFVYLFLRPMLSHTPTLARQWEIIIPILGVLTVAYTYYRNFKPYPTGSAFWLPIAAGIWVLAILVLVVVAPSACKRLGAAFAAEAEEVPPTVSV